MEKHAEAVSSVHPCTYSVTKRKSKCINPSMISMAICKVSIITCFIQEHDFFILFLRRKLRIHRDILCTSKIIAKMGSCFFLFSFFPFPIEHHQEFPCTFRGFFGVLDTSQFMWPVSTTCPPSSVHMGTTLGSWLPFSVNRSLPTGFGSLDQGWMSMSLGQAIPSLEIWVWNQENVRLICSLWLDQRHIKSVGLSGHS